MSSVIAEDERSGRIGASRGSDRDQARPAQTTLHHRRPGSPSGRPDRAFRRSSLTVAIVAARPRGPGTPEIVIKSADGCRQVYHRETRFHIQDPARGVRAVGSAPKRGRRDHHHRCRTGPVSSARPRRGIRSPPPRRVLRLLHAGRHVHLPHDTEGARFPRGLRSRVGPVGKRGRFQGARVCLPRPVCPDGRRRGDLHARGVDARSQSRRGADVERAGDDCLPTGRGESMARDTRALVTDSVIRPSAS